MAIVASLFIVTFLLLHLQSTEAQIGVCYGMLGNNLPCTEDVLKLYNSNNIGAMRLYAPNQETLQGLQGTDIKLMLGVPNEDIIAIACDQSTADDWVETNVVPYAESIKYIAVGNEIHPSDEQASSMVGAMQNIQNALSSNYLDGQIKVSTAIDTTLLNDSYPPSITTFKNLSYVTPIIKFLTTYDSPLLVNIQPYTAYINDMKNIKLDYALFTACKTVFTDKYSGKQYQYQNLFDAIYDSVIVALEKVVTPHNTNLVYGDSKKANHVTVRVVASESGWPSKGGFKQMKNNNRRLMMMNTDDQAEEKAGSSCGWSSDNGGDAATVENAKMYYTNLIKHVKEGTPMTPGQEIETYLFAMFDENQKPGDETEHYFGIFTPDGKPKYGQLNFCSQ